MNKNNKKTKKMENVRKKGQYIIKMVKSVRKNKEYAKDITAWYADTDNEEKAIINYIEEEWQK